jgi:branched-subunit amino acid ABC-type transport system permease component
MRIVNMAHGSYFMLGGYLGLTAALRTRSFAMSEVAATVAIALIGMAMERFFLRRLRGQDLGQVLMTIGFALIFQDLALLIWGGDPYNLPVPAALSGGLRVGGAVFPRYRPVHPGSGRAHRGGAVLALDRTRSGAMIRAPWTTPRWRRRGHPGADGLDGRLALGAVPGRARRRHRRRLPRRLSRPGLRDPALRLRRRHRRRLGSLPGAMVGSVLVACSTTSARRCSPSWPTSRSSRRWR